MSDLIDRQAALDALGEGAMVNYQAAGHNNGLIKASDVIKGLPSAQRWIPCSDRLPEEYGEYLITWETSKAPTRFIGFAEGEETGVWDDQHDRFVFSWLPEDYIIERYPDWRVVAWMPLPEPYKEE